MLNQFQIDFPQANLNEHSFISAPANHTMRSIARFEGTIVISGGLLYCRINHDALCNALYTRYKTCQAEWFGVNSNLKALEILLNEYGYTVKDYTQFFTPSPRFESFESESLTLYEAHEINQFKGIETFNQCYCFDEANPDLLGLSYQENGEIVAMAGLNKTGAHTCEIGINVSPKCQGKGIGSLLVKAITTKAHQIYPTLVVTYGTQFTHTQSINTAINAGFKHTWTEFTISKMKD